MHFCWKAKCIAVGSDILVGADTGARIYVDERILGVEDAFLHHFVTCRIGNHLATTNVVGAAGPLGIQGRVGLQGIDAHEV